MLRFLTGLAPVHTVWILESCRDSSTYTPTYLQVLLRPIHHALPETHTPLHSPTLLTFAGQLLGLGFAGPVFYFLRLVSAPRQPTSSPLPSRQTSRARSTPARAQHSSSPSSSSSRQPRSSPPTPLRSPRHGTAGSGRGRCPHSFIGVLNAVLASVISGTPSLDLKAIAVGRVSGCDSRCASTHLGRDVVLRRPLLRHMSCPRSSCPSPRCKKP